MGILKNLMIRYHQSEIKILERRQEAILHLCVKKSVSMAGLRRKMMMDESLLMISGLGRKISKHQHRINQLEGN